MATEPDPWDEVYRLTEPTSEQRALSAATNRLWDAITRSDTDAVEAVAAEYPSLKHDYTCFFHAIEVANAEAVSFFLAHGADPNAPDESGRTPLWVASSVGYDLVVRWLVEAGADPNVLPEDIDPEAECRGESALFYAALHGDEELVGYLWPRTRPDVRVAARELMTARAQLLAEPGPVSELDAEPNAAPDPGRQ
ncbi:MAG TPA: ankyrin repeat domain-containing protein [Urbifossiella sp.]|nr:ankyrin repeat domain-containing protein [Urbifossiella sp.]